MHKIFMTVDEVADTLKISKPLAYKIVQKMNNELKEQGYITVRGRVNKDYFYDHLYHSKGD